MVRPHKWMLDCKCKKTLPSSIYGFFFKKTPQVSKESATTKCANQTKIETKTTTMQWARASQKINYNGLKGANDSL